MPKNQRNFDPMSEEFDFSPPPAPAPAAPPAPAPPAPPRGSISSRARAAVPAAAADYLEGLNPEQRAAVEMLDGPLLVLAGAGTGKTRVLTTRIAHILATGRARGGQVLAVTFTNKAAREMKQRIGALIGGDVEGMPWLGTFHSIGVKILRRHAELAGLKSGFTILDTDDQIRLLKQVIDAAGIDKDRWPARQLAGLIDGWKNRGQTPDMVPKGEAFAFANGKGGQLYADYQARLKELNAVDFGDLLVECVRLFREHPDVLAEYRSRFRYMLVDEYQDTNTVQYIWLKLLALGRENSHWGHTPSSAASNGSPATAREDLCPQPNQPNICCVGDEDQCLSAGTMVRLGRGGEKRIEAIKAGDSVLSCFGSGDLRPAKVLRVHRRARTGRLVRIVLASGRTLTSTPEHVHFAGYRQGVSPQTNFVYLMQKRGFGFRLGTTQVHTKGQKQPVLGFMQRSLQEHADALWIVSAHASEPEARFEEMRLSLAYGIPTLPFVARKGGSRNGLVHDQAAIARLFDMLDTEAGGSRLLSDHALSIDEPHHHPQSRNASRRNVTVTLCGDRRGSNPMHRLSIVGNDEEGAQALSRLGFSVRPAKAGSSSWRVETAKSSWSEIAADIERMRDAFPLTVIRQARFGRDNAERDKSRASNSLPFRRAASIRPGMVMFTDDGYDVVRSIEQIEERTDVIDLDVEKTHNFVANGIITHNSIYGWRGAEVDNILRFEKDFPGGQVIRLERNYRSTGHILATAAHVIARNQSRLGKTLFTDGQKGDKVTVTGVWDDTEEARIVSDEIERVRKAGHKLNQIAILVRASFQMRAFEDRFITLGLPYRVIGGPRFYERAEIKDAIAYLEVVHNPAHDLKFERIVNVPKRGIGDTTVSRIIAHARNRQIPLATAAAEMIQADELAPKTRRALGDLLRSIERWRGQIGSMRHNELAELIFDESGYTGMLQADKSPQAQSRLENLKELVRLMHDFDTLEGFLEHVALVMDADAGSDGERVSLMTLHAAKGLEFDSVFLPGWEEGLFPHQRSLDESGLKGLEEERRLAYVGITRARKRAAISFTENRRMRGLFQSAIPSRFVDELPETDVEVIEAKGPFSGAYRGLGGGGMAGSRFDGASFQASSYQTPGWQRAQNQNQSQGQSSYPGKSGGTAFGSGKTQRWADKGGGRFPKMIEGQVIASSTGAASSYKIGDRVFHEKFGYGAVSAVDGNKLTVEFDKAGQKKVVDSFIDRA